MKTRLADGKIPAWAERFVRFMDDGFVVPGTRFRVGFDALIGLIPGVGDLVTNATSLSLVWLAYQRELPRAVIGRMLVNLGVDALIGAVPLLGDLFDVVFKANRRNLNLLERYDKSPREAGARDGVFLVLVGVGALLLLTIPFMLAILLVRLLLD
ncbi:MAG: DUF4112 domain-containing protein [Candidatus Binatia bacterium]